MHGAGLNSVAVTTLMASATSNRGPDDHTVLAAIDGPTGLRQYD